MAKRGGGSGRKYVRDSIGRFASKGFSGQSSGRGARLKAKGKKRDGGGAIVKPTRIGEMKNTISKSKSKRKVNASSRATDRQIARDVAARSKPAAARTSKAPTNKAKVAYKRASGDARMRNADLRGADAKERRMANSASAKVKNMQRRRSTSDSKAGADAPRSKQKAREFARIQRAYGNERKAYAAKGDGAGTAKQSRSASVAKRARDIYSGKISASKKTTARLTRTQNPDVLKARIKKGEKLTAARAKKKSLTANSARVTGKLTRPVATGNIRRTGGRLGPKNTIKPGPKSPRTKMNRAIDNVIKKGKALKGSAEKLRGVKKQADALRGRMLKEDKGRLGKALSKPSVTDKRSRDYGGRLTKGARGQDPATGGKKSRPKPTSARDAATAKLKIKTATRRKLKADRSSVIPANPKARRVQGARIGSTVAKKARAKGNAPATVANRVKRKAAVNKANLKENTRYGNATDGKRYVRQVKTSMTLDRAQNFLKTGKLPGKDNSIKAQRSFKAANARINANRAARQMSQKEKWAARAEKRRTQAAKAEANAKRLRDANRKVGDNAFWTQPGLGKQRDKARAGLDKSFKELERAKKLRSRADNLERMSKRNKGDAASRQQSRRDKFDSRKISKGQTVNSTLYGPVKVLRVNKKTVTISLNGGKPFTEDKSRFKEAL